MLPYLIGLFLWGFAEGSFFFVISEVGLAAAVMRFPVRWWQLAAETLVGLLAGGALTYQLGAAHAERLTALLTKLPGHPPALFERIRQDLLERGWGALTLAHVKPRPFKFYALAAGVSDLNLFALLTSGVVARGARLFALSFVVSKASLYWRLWTRPGIAVQTLGAGVLLAALYIGWVEWTYRRARPGVSPDAGAVAPMEPETVPSTPPASEPVEPASPKDASGS